jgi:hypothetical protein
MKQTNKVLMCIVLVAALAVDGAIHTRLSAAQSANSVAPSVEWNRFTVANMWPTRDQVQAHKANLVPVAERATSVGRIERVLNPKYAAPELGGRLTPLRRWRLQVGTKLDKEPPEGNVFLVRQQRGPHIIQVTEGLGCVVVEVRKSDGSRLVGPDTDLAAYAVAAAAEWLSGGMEPKGEAHRALPRWKPHVISWITHDVPESTDGSGLVYQICEAYTDGTFLRYEVIGYLQRSPRAFEPPAPYTFVEGGEGGTSPGPQETNKAQ